MQNRVRTTLATALSLVTLATPLASEGHAGEDSSRPDTTSTTRYKPVAASASTPKRARERTIAPFPVPGDTSARSVLLWRTLNLPRTGTTTIAPLPPPGTQPQASRSNTPALPKLDSLLQKRIEQHQVDCNDEFTHLPEPFHRPDPVVPPGATIGEPKRIIKVFAVVNEVGLVEAAVTPGPASTLDSAAVACVRQWRFKPALHCGHAYPVWVAVPIRFDAR